MIEDLLKQLKFDGEVWEAEISFPVLGEGVLLSIDAADSSGLSKHQTELLKWIYENIENIYPDIKSGIFSYYKDNSEVYRSALGEYADELMPILNYESQLWRYVTEPGIYISNNKESNEIHLEYECAFDVEHGLRVVIENGAIQRVGH